MPSNMYGRMSSLYSTLYFVSTKKVYWRITDSAYGGYCLPLSAELFKIKRHLLVNMWIEYTRSFCYMVDATNAADRRMQSTSMGLRVFLVHKIRCLVTRVTMGIYLNRGVSQKE